MPGSNDPTLDFYNSLMSDDIKKAIASLTPQTAPGSDDLKCAVCNTPLDPICAKLGVWEHAHNIPPDSEPHKARLVLSAVEKAAIAATRQAAAPGVPEGAVLVDYKIPWQARYQRVTGHNTIPATVMKEHEAIAPAQTAVGEGELLKRPRTRHVTGLMAHIEALQAQLREAIAQRDDANREIVNLRLELSATRSERDAAEVEARFRSLPSEPQSENRKASENVR